MANQTLIGKLEEMKRLRAKERRQSGRVTKTQGEMGEVREKIEASVTRNNGRLRDAFLSAVKDSTEIEQFTDIEKNSIKFRIADNGKISFSYDVGEVMMSYTDFDAIKTSAEMIFKYEASKILRVPEKYIILALYADFPE